MAADGVCIRVGKPFALNLYIVIRNIRSTRTLFIVRYIRYMQIYYAYYIIRGISIFKRAVVFSRIKRSAIDFREIRFRLYIIRTSRSEFRHFVPCIRNFPVN